jgi:hypothetical protein
METSSPVPPLLVAEDYDLTFFRSPEALSGYLEPWFVEIEHHAWDGLGRPLELVVVEPPEASGFLNRIRQEAPRIEVRLRAATAGDDCARYLREWLPMVGGPTMPASASLPELLVQALLHGDIH